MTAAILELIRKRRVLLDGGFGTELIRRGLPQGACPETWNVERPDVVREIHTSYFDAGSDAVLTNSFGGSVIKLAAHGEDKRCYELNKAAATIANEVKPAGCFVGGSLGPTGKFLHPQGEFAPGQFEDAYAEQARGLADGRVDFLLIETQYDLREALCAVRAACRVTELPVFVTMTYNRTPRGFFTMMGNSVAQCLEELEREGALALGANCTLDSQDMADLVRIMKEKTSLPLIAQANAGKPSLSAQGKVSYSQGLEDYLRHIPRMIENGADIIGGCCGTNPEYIRRMAAVVK
ncbi:MAG: homocysteine S-methyltransferase family protein [Candidatus Aminicenantales bacterium]